MSIDQVSEIVSSWRQLFILVACLGTCAFFLFTGTEFGLGPAATKRSRELSLLAFALAVGGLMLMAIGFPL